MEARMNGSPGRARIANVINVLVWPLACALMVQNLVLLRQEKACQASLYPPLVEPGIHLGGLVALNMDGARADVELPATGAGRLLVITMSPQVY